jgi:hypothetical protein
MSLMLEFRTPQNPEASSARFGANWCFPTVVPLTNAIDCKGWTASQWESREGRAGHPKAIPTHLVSRSPDWESNTSGLPVNDLLTNAGNSD